MWLVDLNYNFQCDWLIALSVNKLSHNNLASELVEKFLYTNHNRGNCNCSYGYDREKLSVDHFWEFEG